MKINIDKESIKYKLSRELQPVLAQGVPMTIRLIGIVFCHILIFGCQMEPREEMKPPPPFEMPEVPHIALPPPQTAPPVKTVPPETPAPQKEQSPGPRIRDLFQDQFRDYERRKYA